MPLAEKNVSRSCSTIPSRVVIADGQETRFDQEQTANKAVIIAAGCGSRLQGDGMLNCPKPLVQVGGLALLERTILTFEKAGVSEFLVVIGYRGEEIRRRITEKKLPVTIEWIENSEWEKQNGLSVLAADGRVQGPFLLTMSDHLLSVETVRRLLHTPISEGEVILVVDRDVRAVPDSEDATKVCVQGHHVVAIGKDLGDYNGIDTGLFLCTPALFAALRRSQIHGDCSLSDGIRNLAERELVRILDIEGDFWLDVDTKETLALADKLLFQQLTKPEDGVLAKRLNRPISLWVTRLLVQTPVTPNQITVGLLVLGMVAAVLFAQGNPVFMILGAILFQAQSTLDGCDGELARLKFQESRLGGILDVVADGLVTAAGFVGIGLGVSRLSGESLYAVLGAIAGGGTLACTGLLFLLTYRSGRFSGSFRSFSPFKGSLPTDDRLAARFFEGLIRVLDSLCRRDYTYLVLLLALVGYLSYFLWMASVGIVVYLLGLFILYGASFVYE
jgi:1L-myo-inositol 1-phosphate cytidylyltransferase / CDP-L-myo-inositol myo-inositolphosphotransferase